MPRVKFNYTIRKLFNTDNFLTNVPDFDGKEINGHIAKQVHGFHKTLRLSMVTSIINTNHLT